MTLLSPVLGVPIIIFLAIKKMMPAVAFNSIIVATNACRGKWNRHAVVCGQTLMNGLRLPHQVEGTEQQQVRFLQLACCGAFCNFFYTFVK